MKNLLTIFLLFASFALVHAQDVQIRGVVISGSDNYPLPGVNVVVKGTTNGNMTDLDGQFVLSAPDKSLLSISYIGFKSVEIEANASSPMTIVLQEDNELLDEIVVVGYGVQKRSVVTAAISRVSSDELNITRPSRIEDALKGKVSGVQITQSSGQPGADSKVRIRGIGTVNDSEPLYIVDGMPVDGGINYLNPTDIESIEILKDAASAAIYGARAANGVILVTTKQGATGRAATINYDVTYGWQNPWKHRDLLDATQYMTLMNEMQVNDGNAPRYTDAEVASAGKGTDWQKETFNANAPVVSHQVSVNGGTEKVAYFFSLGYFDQEGIIGGNHGKSNYNRWTLRSNNTYNIYEANNRNFLNKVRVGSNISYARAVSTGVETNSEYGSILGSAVAFNPTVPVYATNPEAVLAQYPTAVTDSNGNVFSIPPPGFQEIANPVGMLYAPSLNTLNEDKFVASFWAEVDVYEGLKFRSSYGADLALWGRDGYTFPHFLATQGKNITQSSVNSEMHRGFRWQVENVLTYNKTINGMHNLTVLLGQSAQKYTLRELFGDDYNLLENDPNKANINSAIADRSEERVRGGTGGYNFRSLASYFGRLDYNYDERYIAQATVRRDGSSNFGPQNKWAIFPSFSAGWNITNEEFMESRPEWFSQMRLRASWGKNGNERIGTFRYTSLMSGGQNYYFGNGTEASMVYGSSPSRISNPNVKWEESEQINFGLESRFFNSALTFGFDYFKKTTKGMLMDQPIPTYAGKNAPISNAGDMENWGLEFESTYKVRAGKVNLSFGANASFLKNELINLGNATGENIYANAGAAGVGSYVKGKNGFVYPFFYGFITDGIIQNATEAAAYNSLYGENAQPGDVRFTDLNGDGSINDDDKTMIGKGMPDWTVGFNFGAEWNNFDFNAFFQGTIGNDIYDFSQRGDIPATNRPSWMLGRWHGEGTSNWYPRMTSENPNRNWRSSDLYVKDGSYLRLKTVQLGYTLPSALTRKASIQNLRFFVSAENLLTFTSYDGFDPEVAAGGDYFNIGVDKGNYPQSRTISLGANITF